MTLAMNKARSLSSGNSLILIQETHQASLASVRTIWDPGCAAGVDRTHSPLSDFQIFRGSGIGLCILVLPSLLLFIVE